MLGTEEGDSFQRDRIKLIMIGGGYAKSGLIKLRWLGLINVIKELLLQLGLTKCVRCP